MYGSCSVQSCCRFRQKQSSCWVSKRAWGRGEEGVAIHPSRSKYFMSKSLESPTGARGLRGPSGVFGTRRPLMTPGLDLDSCSEGLCCCIFLKQKVGEAPPPLQKADTNIREGVSWCVPGDPERTATCLLFPCVFRMSTSGMLNPIRTIAIGDESRR